MSTSTPIRCQCPRIPRRNVPSVLRHGVITADALRRMYHAEREATRELIAAIPEDARPPVAFRLWRQQLRRLERTFPPEGRSRALRYFLRHHGQLIEHLTREDR